MEDDHAEDGETVDHGQVVGQLRLSRAEFARGEVLEELEHPSVQASLPVLLSWDCCGGRWEEVSQSVSLVSIYVSGLSETVTLLRDVWFVLRSAVILLCSYNID